jgi:hypothetical protein
MSLPLFPETAYLILDRKSCCFAGFGASGSGAEHLQDGLRVRQDVQEHRATLRRMISEKERSRITSKNRLLGEFAVSLRRQVLLVQSAENGEPVDSSAFDLPELDQIDDQQAAFYKKFIQGSIKTVVPDFYEAILQQHYPEAQVRYSIAFIF